MSDWSRERSIARSLVIRLLFTVCDVRTVFILDRIIDVSSHVS